mgnify:CR=1 FL=1
MVEENEIEREKQARQYGVMTETKIPQLILRLSVPTVLSMLITGIYNLADTYFVGQLNNTSASGAIGVVASLMAIIQALGFMLGHGAGSHISRSLGNRDAETATRYASTSFFTALLFGGILTIVGLLTLDDFMMLLGSTDTILPHASGYALYILLAAPIMISSLVMNNILRYEGKAFFAMIGLVSGGILNMVLDPVFIFGFGMGAAGAGLATAISQCVSFLLLLSAFLRGKTVSRFSLCRVTRSTKEFFGILAVGLPSFGRQGLSAIAGMLLNIAASGYGDAAVAAMSIVNRIFMFLMSVVLGIGQGFQPVAAFNYGAKKYRRVRDAALFTVFASTIAVLLLGSVCYFFAPELIRAFQNDDDVLRIALPTFRYQAIALILEPVIVPCNMLYQSVGKAAVATPLAMCRQGIFFLPLILTLPSSLGLVGIQIAQPIADVLTFLVTFPFLILFLVKLSKDKPW